MVVNPWLRSAGEIGELVRGRALTAVEVVSRHLAWVAGANPRLNAFTAVAGDEALAAAQAIDDAVARCEPVGPLAGVPFSVKDVVAVRGLPLEGGSTVLAGRRAVRDATAVARLRAAGAICLGKTNTPEFALSTRTWNPVHGSTINPIAPQRRLSPGGPAAVRRRPSPQG